MTEKLRLDQRFRELGQVNRYKSGGKIFYECVLLCIKGDITTATDSRGGRAFPCACGTENHGRKILHSVPQVLVVKMDAMGKYGVPQALSQPDHAGTVTDQTLLDKIIGAPHLKKQLKIPACFCIGESSIPHARQRFGGEIDRQRLVTGLNLFNDKLIELGNEPVECIE